MSTATVLKSVSLNLIRENKTLLRTIKKDAEDYQELVQSIRVRGVLNAISLREIQPETNGGPILYAVIDGTNRFNAAKDAGLEEIPAQIMSMDDAQVEEAQIIANVHKIETKAVDYTKALVRILERNPLMTEAELASLVHKSPTWIRERFSLLKLHPDLQVLVNEGDIKVISGYALAKLPEEEQIAFRDRAITMQPGEFTANVNQRVKELRAAKLEGRDPNSVDAFVPTPMLRSKGDVVDEQVNGTNAKTELAAVDAKNAFDGWRAAINWVTQMDPASLKVAEAKHAARIAERTANREKAEAERTAKRLERAKATLAEAEAAASKAGVTV